MLIGHFMCAVVVLFSISATASLNEHCNGATPRSIRCINATHYRRFVRRAVDVEDILCDISPCRFGFSCVESSCRAQDLHSHLYRAADFQIVLSVPASQLQQCTPSHANDVARGLMLCDLWHSTRETQPTFGHIFGNTWLHFGFGPNATAPECSASPAAWRQCFANNMAQQIAALQGESPELMLSGGLMEYLNVANVDQPSDFPAGYCRPGSVGQWGENNSTCVPDVTLPLAQQYYISWGKHFLDAGIRAIFFGQALLTGGRRTDGTDSVSPEGAAGFLVVISALRQYANECKYGPTFFGPQAAAGIVLANGTQIADWAYGAQHLEAHNVTQLVPNQQPTFLTQPFLRNGSFILAAQEQYGVGDFHDASRWQWDFTNTTNGLLPVVLDYDNFASDPAIYDDIRRLAAWPTRTKSQLVVNHVRYARSYNPFAHVTIPFTKWLAVPNECNCYVNNSIRIWGASDVYFSAFACGLVETAKALWLDPFVSPLNDGVEKEHLGQQLQGSDDTAVFVFATVLGRNFSSRQEYYNAVVSMPIRMYTASGARCSFVETVVSSVEFITSICSPLALGPLQAAVCAVNRSHQAILLKDPSPQAVEKWAPAIANGTCSIAQALEMFCSVADKDSLYALK